MTKKDGTKVELRRALEEHTLSTLGQPSAVSMPGYLRLLADYLEARDTTQSDDAAMLASMRLIGIGCKSAILNMVKRSAQPGKTDETSFAS